MNTILAWGQDYSYPWRGIMIDVSRHFMPIEYLYKEIDAMQYVGLNRLHLHLTDAAGWRIEIKSRPRLTEVGAWRTDANWEPWWNGDRKYSDSTHGHGGYYTQDELRLLVNYAAERGIEIIPEIEFPAHSEEVIAAYPEVGFNHAELDMKKEASYQLMRDVLEEVAAIFPSKYLHLGGDEAGTQHDLQPEGMRRVKEIVDSLGRTMIVWDEALTDNPNDSDMVIMVWRDPQTAQRAVDLGHDVILSPGRYCYLDKAQDAPSLEPKCAGGYLPIDSLYMMPNPLSVPGSRHLLGVQANLWTEHIPNPEYAEYMLWPRACAIAEIGRVGLSDKRNLMQFRENAIKTNDYLRSELHINAFDLRQERGQRPQVNTTSVPFSILYNSQPHRAYPGQGETTLCDHRIGGWSNNDGSWQGFLGSQGMDVTLDLGEEKEFHSISIDFMQSIAPDIFFPYTLIISTGENGRDFTQLSHSQHSDIYAKRSGSCATQSEDYRQLGWNGTHSARYIRIQALPGPNFGWVFCSEIFIQ